jgi:hypothetical protein
MYEQDREVAALSSGRFFGQLKTSKLRKLHHEHLDNLLDRCVAVTIQSQTNKHRHHRSTIGAGHALPSPITTRHSPRPWHLTINRLTIAHHHSVSHTSPPRHSSPTSSASHHHYYHHHHHYHHHHYHHHHHHNHHVITYFDPSFTATCHSPSLRAHRPHHHHRLGLTGDSVPREVLQHQLSSLRLDLDEKKYV